MFKYKEDIYKLSDVDLAFACRVFLNKTITDEEFDIIMSPKILTKILSISTGDDENNTIIYKDNEKLIKRKDIIKEISQVVYNNSFPLPCPNFIINEKKQLTKNESEINGTYNSNNHTIVINLNGNETPYNLVYLVNHELTHSQQHFVAQFGAIKDNLQCLKNHENDFISDIIDFYKNKGCNVSKKDININNIYEFIENNGYTKADLKALQKSIIHYEDGSRTQLTYLQQANEMDANIKGLKSAVKLYEKSEQSLNSTIQFLKFSSEKIRYVINPSLIPKPPNLLLPYHKDALNINIMKKYSKHLKTIVPSFCFAKEMLDLKMHIGKLLFIAEKHKQDYSNKTIDAPHHLTELQELEESKRIKRDIIQHTIDNINKLSSEDLKLIPTEYRTFAVNQYINNPNDQNAMWATIFAIRYEPQNFMNDFAFTAEQLQQIKEEVWLSNDGFKDNVLSKIAMYEKENGLKPHTPTEKEISQPKNIEIEIDINDEER